MKRSRKQTVKVSHIIYYLSRELVQTNDTYISQSPGRFFPHENYRVNIGEIYLLVGNMVPTVLNEVVHATFAPCEEVFRIAH